jgi:hypothetical protein
VSIDVLECRERDHRDELSTVSILIQQIIICIPYSVPSPVQPIQCKRTDILGTSMVCSDSRGSRTPCGSFLHACRSRLRIYRFRPDSVFMLDVLRPIITPTKEPFAHGVPKALRPKGDNVSWLARDL